MFHHYLMKSIYGNWNWQKFNQVLKWSGLNDTCSFRNTVNIWLERLRFKLSQFIDINKGFTLLKIFILIKSHFWKKMNAINTLIICYYIWLPVPEWKIGASQCMLCWLVTCFQNNLLMVVMFFLKIFDYSFKLNFLCLIIHAHTYLNHFVIC